MSHLCHVLACQCYIDAAFLLDASTKSSDAWQNILNFVVSVVSNFNISPTCVRVVVILYADRADASIPWNRYGDSNSLQQGIRSLTLMGGNSNLLTALQLLRQVFAPSAVRSGATLVAGIVTDRLTCNTQITSEANYLKTSSRVNFVGVSVSSTRAVDVNCLNQVVSPNRHFEVPDYRLLSTYASQVSPYMCTVPAPNLAPWGEYSVRKQSNRFKKTKVLILNTSL